MFGYMSIAGLERILSMVVYRRLSDLRNKNWPMGKIRKNERDQSREEMIKAKRRQKVVEITYLTCIIADKQVGEKTYYSVTYSSCHTEAKSD